MRTRQEVITDMLHEIHDLCTREGIAYCVHRAALRSILRNERLTEDLITANLAMDAANFDRFIEAFNRDPIKDRRIEWLGNNPEFPGLFLRYIDITTTHYNATRLAAEKNLGMYVTIEVIRPGLSKRRQDVLELIEKSWSGRVLYGEGPSRKLGQLIDRAMSRRIRRKGRQEAALGLYHYLIRQYSKSRIGARCWFFLPRTLATERFAKGQYADISAVGYMDGELCVPEYYESRPIYRARKDDVKPYKNSIVSFCDTEIPFEEFDFTPYKPMAVEYIVRMREMNTKIKPYKEERRRLFDIMYRTYYRYYYGMAILDRMEEVERLYADHDREQLDRILGAYVKVLKKYKNVYLSERINEIVYDLYGLSPAQVYQNMPEQFLEGVRLYDYKGNYIRTLGDADEYTAE